MSQSNARLALCQALHDETARVFCGDDPAERTFVPNWHGGGGGFNFIHRPLTGNTVVEIDFDFAAKLGDVPRWIAVVWRNGTAFDADAADGRLAVLWCDCAPPSACGPEDFAKLGRFAVGALRFAPAVELIHYAEDRDA